MRMVTTGRLAGRVALISGAARGQGAVEAAVFLREGAAGVVLGDVLENELDATAASLGEAFGGRVAHRTLDVTLERDWAAAATLAEERFGGLHVLVNNAGIASAGPGNPFVEDLDPAGWQRVLDVNLTGAFLGMRACLPLLRRTVTDDVAADPRRSASVVNISSAQAFRPSAGNAAYAASKWGLRGLTKAVALEAAPEIRVNAVMPGPVATPMIAAALEDDTAGILTQLVRDVPLGRVGTPEEVADLVLYLASTESSYCTGAEFLIEGGRVAGPARPRG
jgi:3alpha(or 20beta)-hydroxysteroid dehydrogenase